MADLSPNPAEFDEAFYLRSNPDVAAAVAAGDIASGRAHFLSWGQREGRIGASTAIAAITGELSRLISAEGEGRLFAQQYRGAARARSDSVATSDSNPLRRFFEQRVTGAGIWKWQHYFECYHRHLHRFRSRGAAVLEIGVYSGGSLHMWQDYFGATAKIFGVDVEPACTVYAGPNVNIFIGDQADRDFWGTFRQQVPTLDVVIDDGGHLFRQQAVTLEEILPHLQPGGVYICEDIHGENNAFAAYVSGLTRALNTGEMQNDLVNPERRLFSAATAWQSEIASITHYPMMVVIEKHSVPTTEFVAPKHGTVWQPHLR